MARRCKHSKCQNELPPARQCTTFLGKKGLCSDDCAIAYGLEAAQKAADKKRRKEVRQAKDRLKSLSAWVTDAQKWVNRVVVAEDKHKGCISCGSPDVSDAGHYFHRGSKYRTSPLTLDRRNLNGQCRSCNSFKGGGNQHEYRLGYIARYGQEAFNDLCEYKRSVDRGEVPNLTIDECKDRIKQAKARLKKIKTL